MQACYDTGRLCYAPRASRPRRAPCGPRLSSRLRVCTGPARRDDEIAGEVPVHVQGVDQPGSRRGGAAQHRAPAGVEGCQPPQELAAEPVRCPSPLLQVLSERGEVQVRWVLGGQLVDGRYQSVHGTSPLAFLSNFCPTTRACHRRFCLAHETCGQRWSRSGDIMFPP